MKNKKKIKYAECLQAVSSGYYEVGKIYKIYDESSLPQKLRIIADQGYNVDIINWTEEFISLGNNCFKIVENYTNNSDCKDEVIKEDHNTIKAVRSEEGAIFELGDKITVFTKNSPNKGKMFTIKGFRWSLDKHKICVITESHGRNGIGLDKIELHTELSLLDLAKIKYPVGCEVNNFKIIGVSSSFYPGNFNCGSEFKEEHNYIVNVLPQGHNRTIYNKILGQWAEIVK
jgi:hypothetical protein